MFVEFPAAGTVGAGGLRQWSIPATESIPPAASLFVETQTIPRNFEHF
jgi:hypothetical protein